ncbi:MAG TPA: gluconate 2-dehydrogenase subunit 3 family protein [Vicinamibacterales bacterium]
MLKLISRRELLKRAGVIGAAAVVPAGAHHSPRVDVAFAPPQAPPAREPLEHLTATEADALEAIVERLIPTDARGPGAKEARAARYIDHALGVALASSRPLYAAGLAAAEQAAQSSRGRAFKDLRPEEQDDILSAFESGTVQSFAGAAAFFALVRAHTIQGTFCDPYYGGNAGFVGWELIGYPGVRTLVTPDDQRLGAEVPFNHKSAYDYEMFTKTIASAAPMGAVTHGD